MKKYQTKFIEPECYAMFQCPYCNRSFYRYKNDITVITNPDQQYCNKTHRALHLNHGFFIKRTDDLSVRSYSVEDFEELISSVAQFKLAIYLGRLWLNRQEKRLWKHKKNGRKRLKS